jgi:signal transduction histidine kinase
VAGLSDQRIVQLATGLAVSLLLALWFVAETGHTRLREATRDLALAQQRLEQLSSLQQLLFDAEASQRGFLLTDDPRYLQSFDPAVAQIEPLLDRMANGFAQTPDPGRLDTLRRLRMRIGMKLGEMLGSLRLYGERDRASALALIDTDIGKKMMDDVRALITTLQRGERERIERASQTWATDLQTTRRLFGAGAALNIALVLLAGYLLLRDLLRRELLTADLRERNRELDRLVQERTATLSDLSSHLQNLTELEKAALARELHDELGGLLVSTKMDVVWLRRRLDAESPEFATRWDRVLRSLEHGVEFKRRVIESLRPTLLDNLGLIPALRWLTDETCEQASLSCKTEFPEDLPDLAPAASIAVFRAVQESLTNIVKHARATQVQVRVHSDEAELSVSVLDDGVGILPERVDVPQSHGLSGMRHRILGLGGDLSVARRRDAAGTIVTLRLPWARIRPERDASVPKEDLHV